MSSIDPQTGDKVDVFNPRTDAWADHFSITSGEIVGMTPIGRATVRLLNMNHHRRIELHRLWLDQGGSF